MQDIGSQPYNFSVLVRDNSCPVNGIGIYTYSIYVDSCFATGEIPISVNNIQHFSASFSEANHCIDFRYDLIDPYNGSISLYDLTGRKIKELQMPRLSSQTGKLDVAGIYPGVYVLNLKTGTGDLKSVKLVIGK